MRRTKYDESTIYGDTGLAKPVFDLAELTRWCANERTLIVGLGGGADILLVKAVAGLLEGRHSTPAEVLLANTKGTKPYRRLELLEGFNYVGRVERGYKPSRGKLASAHGTVRIDALVHCADGNGAFIFQLPYADESAGCDQLTAEIRNLGVDSILAVDGGGDALTEPGERDGRMLRILEETGLPLRLLIAAPGCDGQSSHSELLEVMGALEERGDYLGWFDLEPAFPEIRRLAALLPEKGHKRVVQIIIAARDRTLDEDPATGWAIVPRERRLPIPWEWLTRGYLFDCVVQHGAITGQSIGK